MTALVTGPPGAKSSISRQAARPTAAPSGNPGHLASTGQVEPPRARARDRVAVPELVALGHARRDAALRHDVDRRARSTRRVGHSELQADEGAARAAQAVAEDRPVPAVDLVVRWKYRPDSPATSPEPESTRFAALTDWVPVAVSTARTSSVGYRTRFAFTHLRPRLRSDRSPPRVCEATPPHTEIEIGIGID